jgi:hypothetical protein
MTNDKSAEQSWSMPSSSLPDEADFEITRGNYIRGLSFVLFAACRHSFSDGWPLCGYYVILADLNMPPPVICHLSSVIRFALGYRLSAIGYFAKRAIGYSRSA